MLAQLIDAAILAAVVVGGLFGLALLGGLSDVLAVTLAILLVTVLPFAYFLVLEARTATTPGKRALRIRVVSDEGAPIGWSESAIRNLLRLIDFLPAFYVLGGTLATISSSGKRLGDMAAGTVCVRVPPQAAHHLMGGATTSFASAAGQVHEGRVPLELVLVLDEFRRRREGLAGDVRTELAERIAVRLEPYHPRPEGMSVEEFVVRAAVTYAPSRKR